LSIPWIIEGCDLPVNGSGLFELPRLKVPLPIQHHAIACDLQARFRKFQVLRCHFMLRGHAHCSAKALHRSL